jgi:anti-sigma factor RsiW
MKCDEAQALQGLYLDSELDPTSTVKIEQHLKSCPDCSRLFAEEQRLDRSLRTALSRGQRSPALWEKAEQAVLAAAYDQDRQARDRQSRPALPWSGLLTFLAYPWRSSGGASRWVWAGLGAAWVTIFLFNAAAREVDGPKLARQAAPSSAAMHFAMKQKQQIMAELSIGPEQILASKPKTGAPGPRSERHVQTFNT